MNNLYQPILELIGGPMDGLKNWGASHYLFEKVTTFDDGGVAARVTWPDHPNHWLLYRGELGFEGEKILLAFIDYYPANLTPTDSTRERSG